MWDTCLRCEKTCDRVQPEAYVGHLGQAFDAEGNLTEDRTRAHLEAVMRAFAVWVARQAA